MTKARRGYLVHLDCFTSLDELAKRERGDSGAVLDVLRRTKRFSVWDMDDPTLAATVMWLKDTGKITFGDKLGFPWQDVEVSDG